MKLSDFFNIILLSGLFFNIVAGADYYGYDGDDDNQSYAQKYYGDGGSKNEYYTSNGDNYQTYKGDYQKGDDITYWTEYAILPKKCIRYGKKDMIVFSLYEKYYNHCKDRPIGTYMADVPTFVQGWADQMELVAEEMDGDDIVVPDTTYINCYPYETNYGVYYVKLGCGDGDSQSLAVNLYSDNTCETPNRSSYGSDDVSIDVSSFNLPFKQCQQCVNFVDKNEDDVDDQYFTNKMTNAPFCSTAWTYKQKCDARCRGSAGSSWNQADLILLAFFSCFVAVMFGAISKKRGKMARKDLLLEEAAMSAVGLQITHIIGFFALTAIIAVIFGLMGIKSMTWFLVLLITFLLFVYLMKLTIDSGINAPVGPDGEPLGDDDSDDDDEEEEDKEEGGEVAGKSEYRPPAETESGLPENLPPIS